jgi:hypothetical protein
MWFHHVILIYEFLPCFLIHSTPNLAAQFREYIYLHVIVLQFYHLPGLRLSRIAETIHAEIGINGASLVDNGERGCVGDRVGLNGLGILPDPAVQFAGTKDKRDHQKEKQKRLMTFHVNCVDCDTFYNITKLFQ